MKPAITRITMTTAHPVFAAVDAAVAAGDTQVDLSGVEHLDSSLVALLMHARRRAKAAGKDLRVVNAPAALSRLLAAYGIEVLFDGTLV